MFFSEEHFLWFKTTPTGWKVKSFQSDLCTITKYHYFSAHHCRTLSTTTYPSIPLSKRCPGLWQTKGRVPTGLSMITLIHSPIVLTRSRLVGLLLMVFISLFWLFWDSVMLLWCSYRHGSLSWRPIWLSISVRVWPCILSSMLFWCISEALLCTLTHCILDSTCYATPHCPLHLHLCMCHPRLFVCLFVCLFTFVTSARVVCLFPLLDCFC